MPLSKRYYITDGQFMITTIAANIHTVLGSCVSVCLRDTEKKIAGINHYLLPGSPESPPGNANHGHSSIRMLIRSMLNRGAKIENMEGKIFGGCNSWVREDGFLSVGRKNIEVANLLLKEAGIHIVAQDTGGIRGRKIIFNTATGKVKVYVLNKTAAEVNEEIRKGFGY